MYMGPLCKLHQWAKKWWQWWKGDYMELLQGLFLPGQWSKQSMSAQCYAITLMLYYTILCMLYDPLEATNLYISMVKPNDFLSIDLTSSVNFGQVTEIQAILLLHDFLSSDLTSSLNFGQVTDIHTYIQNTMHKSPPCIRTGGLKKALVTI